MPSFLLVDAGVATCPQPDIYAWVVLPVLSKSLCQRRSRALSMLPFTVMSEAPEQVHCSRVRLSGQFVFPRCTLVPNWIVVGFKNTEIARVLLLICCDFFFFLDNRPANAGNDRTVPDLNDGLPNTSGGLPEDSVYSCVSVSVWSAATSAHTASSGAGGSGTVTFISLYLWEHHIASGQCGSRSQEKHRWLCVRCSCLEVLGLRHQENIISTVFFLLPPMMALDLE